jgi:hypothetical protein
MTEQISPEEWATRIPWHPKARILDTIETRIQHLREEVTQLETRCQELTLMLDDHRQLSQTAHAAYRRGDRHDWVLAGERVYQRNRKRKPGTCPECGWQTTRASYLPTHIRLMHGADSNVAYAPIEREEGLP